MGDHIDLIASEGTNGPTTLVEQLMQREPSYQPYASLLREWAKARARHGRQHGDFDCYSSDCRGWLDERDCSRHLLQVGIDPSQLLAGCCLADVLQLHQPAAASLVPPLHQAG